MFQCRLPTPAANCWELEEAVLRVPTLLPSVVSIFASSGKAVHRQNNILWNIGTISEQNLSTSLNMEATFNWAHSDSSPDVMQEAINRMTSGRLRGHLSFRCPRWNLSGCRIAALEIARAARPFFKGCRHTVVASDIEYQF
eukprot:Protomagalhaensia_sp_Gyna_25__1724@NODE_1900_length_1432_cov_22_867911_g1562_i0_p3_GENE_NODE_1900_length_1432_cov_22_867911_g1562_i0NODE_1900_length_1432_cov_22_867911_g1562_i0_p3_ORF_typecomplete_len141_score13_25Adap_comp_sub/PF00928_21/1_9e09DdrB/PF12747_7/0_25_NODE_1900_length_1432_cov_22_867911_g1562_i0525947